MENLSPGRLRRDYTVLLFCYGGVSLLLALMMPAALSRVDAGLERSLALSSELHLLFGAAAVFVALLRGLGGIPFRPVSTGLSMALVLEFPLGTLLFIYWLVRVRREERRLPAGKADDRYTTGLWVAGLGCFLAAVTFRDVLRMSGEISVLAVLTVIYCGLGVLLVLVSAVRCANRRWGYYATFLLNILLLPLLPLGTALSLYWFLSRRKQERQEPWGGMSPSQTLD